MKGGGEGDQAVAGGPVGGGGGAARPVPICTVMSCTAGRLATGGGGAIAAAGMSVLVRGQARPAKAHGFSPALPGA